MHRLVHGLLVGKGTEAARTTAKMIVGTLELEGLKIEIMKKTNDLEFEGLKREVSRS